MPDIDPLTSLGMALADAGQTTPGPSLDAYIRALVMRKKLNELGFVIVPKEPMPDMTAAGAKVLTAEVGRAFSGAGIENNVRAVACYKAMIAAASTPTPTSSGEK